MIYYIKENLTKKMNDGLTIQNWIENASLEKFNQIDVNRYLHAMFNHGMRRWSRNSNSITYS